MTGAAAPVTWKRRDAVRDGADAEVRLRTGSLGARRRRVLRPGRRVAADRRDRAGVDGHDPLDAVRAMFDYGTEHATARSSSSTGPSRCTSPALAVAIGFRMNLFNIGVEGQYRLAALLAAVVGGRSRCPAPLHDPADHRGGDGGRRASGPASPAC